VLPAAPRPKFASRITTAILTWMNFGPFIALHVVALMVFFVPFSWEALGLAVGLFFLRTWGLTAGFHRYFAHRGYKTSRWFQFVIAWIGCMAVQKGPLWWAGEHRKHHRYSDKDEDPHSPISGSVWWSHIGWVLHRDRRWTDMTEMKDWDRFPELKWVDKYFAVPPLVMGVAAYLWLGWPGVVYTIASTVFLYHTTFMVNSVCHLVGYRTFETDDHSRNNWFVAALTMGEGWHNNHHHYPSAARQGFKWYEVDASYIVLWLMSKVGLVWDLRQPTPRALAHRKIENPAITPMDEAENAPAAAS
jgi:stearoyl-CoA desaturase (Delta-9 desaturase)